nr:unnamed protein product [Callosobruchus analis]
MVDFLLTHIDHLEDYLEYVFQRTGNERRNMIKLCVEYHQHTLSLAADTKKAFTKVLGFMSMLWAITLGAIANQVQHSSGVADKVYATKWYEGTPSEMRDLQFMIARSHVICTIPATPFGRYEYALFIMSGS